MATNYYVPQQSQVMPQQNIVQQQSIIPQSTPTMNGFTTIPVDGEQDVLYYPVAAGYQAMLISFKDGKFWIKETSKNGVPEPLRVFNFKEEVITPQKQDYISRTEFDELSTKLDKLISSLGGDN